MEKLSYDHPLFLWGQLLESVEDGGCGVWHGGGVEGVNDTQCTVACRCERLHFN